MIDQPALGDAQVGLVVLLQLHGVRVLVIGGWAVRAHGHDRATTDLDPLASNSKQNAKRVERAFAAVGFPAPPQGWRTAASTPNIRFAYPSEEAKEADLLASIDGIDFDSCYSRSVRVPFGDLALHVPARADLIAMKQVSASVSVGPGRAQDLADLEWLQANAG